MRRTRREEEVSCRSVERPFFPGAILEWAGARVGHRLGGLGGEAGLNAPSAQRRRAVDLVKRVGAGRGEL